MDGSAGPARPSTGALEAANHDGTKNAMLFQLYLAMRSEHVEWVTRHSENFSHYLTLVVAILGVTAAAVYQLYESDAGGTVAGMVGFVGFAANIGLCFVAILGCNRLYRRYIEAVTVMAKLEASLALNVRRPHCAEQRGEIRPFANDACLLPGRWGGDPEGYGTAKSFVKAMTKKGVNMLVWVTMGLLILVNSCGLVGSLLLLRGWSPA